jgi:DNA-binding transcriptional MerR regulator
VQSSCLGDVCAKGGSMSGKTRYDDRFQAEAADEAHEEWLDEVDERLARLVESALAREEQLEKLKRTLEEIVRTLEGLDPPPPARARPAERPGLFVVRRAA